jgi:uncharacterized protein YdaU (DUF1376 family)
MHYYSHHIGDFDRGTRHLSRIERSIYLDLIFQYYETEGALTLDVSALCRKIVARTEEEKAAVLAVLDEFFHETPNGWYHDRCEEEIAAYRTKAGKASSAGKASAAARAERRKSAMGEAPTGVERRSSEDSTDAQQTFNERSTDVDSKLNLVSTQTQHGSNVLATNQEPRTKNHKPEKSSARASRLPLDWTPSAEDLDYCQTQRPELDPDRVSENFRDYWHAKAGKDAAKIDWAAAWRSWVRNERAGPLTVRPVAKPAVKDWQ